VGLVHYIENGSGTHILADGLSQDLFVNCIY
jgi:predicted GNAT family N-acyltransferase